MRAGITRAHRARSAVVAVAAAVLALLAGGCAMLTPPQPGTQRAAVLQQWGAPTGRYALPDGGERLEYASGPWGRTTWMVDIGRDGRVRGAHQALGEAQFADLAARVAGMTPQQVLFELGRPAQVRAVGWQGGELWSWRYPTNDCLWFQVGFDRERHATSAGYGIDWSCDPPNDRQ